MTYWTMKEWEYWDLYDCVSSTEDLEIAHVLLVESLRLGEGFTDTYSYNGFLTEC